MTEDLIKEIVSYPCKVALLDPACVFLLGDCITQLEKDEALYLTSTMTNAIDIIVDNIIEETKPDDNLKIAKDHLIRAYTYCFDKSIEIVYHLIVKTDNEIEFNFSDLYNGMGGDKIPEYIQLKVIPIIPKVAMTFNATFDFIIESGYTKQVTTRELIKAILFGGMYLGTEYCLRIDINDDSEFRSYMAD